MRREPCHSEPQAKNPFAWIFRYAQNDKLWLCRVPFLLMKSDKLSAWRAFDNPPPTPSAREGALRGVALRLARHCEPFFEETAWQSRTSKRLFGFAFGVAFKKRCAFGFAFF